MGWIIDYSGEVAVLYATSQSEVELVKREAEGLELGLKQSFDGIPSFNEFCEEVGVDSDLEDVDLSKKDFGVAVICGVLDLSFLNDKYTRLCERESLDISPEHLEIISSNYDKLF